jgi:cardiolipin synthase
MGDELAMHPFIESTLEPSTPKDWVLLKGSDEFFPALVRCIDAAKEEVRLETYIFDFSLGALGVAHALERAAVRGVHVMVMLDGFGTPVIALDWRERWQRSRVELLCYSPMIAFVTGWPANWRRLHRKLCVVDRTHAFCGGVNLLDDHWDPHAQQTLVNPRLDFVLQVWGPVAHNIHKSMEDLWTRVALSQAMRTLSLVRVKSQAEVLEAWWKTFSPALAPPDQWEAGRGARAPTHPPSMRLVLRDNVSHRWQIQASYLHAIERARSEIWIANAFFFPSSRMLQALCAAARRGVQVHVLLAGRAEYAWMYRATWHLYGVLIKSGIEIHEYTPSFLHAKVAVVDEDWSTVGSSNLDPLSLMMAREANIVAHSKALVLELKAQLQLAKAQGSVQVKAADIRGRSRYNRCLDWLAFGSVFLALKLARVPY